MNLGYFLDWSAKELKCFAIIHVYLKLKKRKKLQLDRYSNKCTIYH